MNARTKDRARVLIADNHARFAETCRGILEPEFDVVCVVGDGTELAQSVAKWKPDVVIIDMVMPPVTGFEAGAQVNAIRPETKIIYMTVAAEPGFAAEAFRSGAYAYLSKRLFPEDLRNGVRRAMRGELYLSPVVGPQESVEDDYLLRGGRWRRGIRKN